MQTSKEEISLLNLMGGALIERTDIEIKRVLENIADPNTEAKKPRKVILEITFAPNEERNLTTISGFAHPKLAPFTPVNTMATVGKNIHGKAEAHEYTPPKQQALPMGEPQSDGKVTRLPPQEKANNE